MRKVFTYTASALPSVDTYAYNIFVREVSGAVFMMEAVTPLVFFFAFVCVFKMNRCLAGDGKKKKIQKYKKHCGCFYRIHEYFNLAFNRGEGALCTSKHRCCLPRRHPNPSFWNAFAALYRLLEVKMRLKRCHYVNQQSAYSLLWKPTSPVIYHLCSLGVVVQSWTLKFIQNHN